MTHAPDPGKVRELFDLLVDLPPDDRRRHLDAHCPDPVLRREVERLLAADAPSSREPPTGSAALISPTMCQDVAGLQPSEDGTVVPRLSGYDVLGRVAAGGMGVVWRVRDLAFGRDLALKVMMAGHSERRFLDEAHICGRLAHPFIVPVHALGWLADGRPYYLMKLVGGETLATLLRRRAMPAEDLTRWVQVFAQVCQAVGYAHANGVIHRDLKPANVMVGAHGEVQVMDWGLAKDLVGTAAPSDEPADANEVVGATQRPTHDRTRPGAVMGTLKYMPPEQANGRVAEVGPRSDVFSLGAILCEILTGQPPYTGGDADVRRKAKRPVWTRRWPACATAGRTPN